MRQILTSNMSKRTLAGVSDSASNLTSNKKHKDSASNSDEDTKIASESTDTTIKINKDGSVESNTKLDNANINATADNTGKVHHTVERNGVATKASSDLYGKFGKFSHVVLGEDRSITSMVSSLSNHPGCPKATATFVYPEIR